MAVYAVWQFFQGGGQAVWVVRLDAPSSAVAQVTINPLTLRAASGPGTSANGLVVELQPSRGAKQLVGAAPGTPDHVDLLVTSRGSSAQPAVKELISGLAANGKGGLSSAINDSSFYVRAAEPEETVTPDSKPFEGTSVTVGGLTLTTAAAWPPDALTATITASAGGAGLVDLILESEPREVLEILPSLSNASSATDLAALVTQESEYLSATPEGTGTGPLLPQIQELKGGVDANWSADSFMTAVMAQLGEPGSPSTPTPLLDQIGPDLFNIMLVPDLAFLSTTEQGSAVAAAHRFCKARQAFLIVDPPPPAAAMTTAWLAGAGAVPIDDVGTPTGMKGLQDWAGQFDNPDNDAAAVYYPWVQIADPWNSQEPRYVPPSGSVAGVYAATDTSDTSSAGGVWKAPAGQQAQLRGVTGLADLLDDSVVGALNVRGINCLRTLAGYGNVVWGARTLAGDDLRQSPFKYVSTRRLADFIEQSLRQSTQWAVFEPNDPQLWTQLANETNAFMAGLFGAGAFAGLTSAQAFTVTCDATTTSAHDVAAGIVNLSVGFQPSGPAEFVVLNLPVNAGAPAAG
jgi:hypothetical protein